MSDLAQASTGKALRLWRSLPATLLIGAAISLAWILLALLAPVLTGYDPIAVDGTLGIVFASIEADKKQLIFKDHSGATVTRKY